MQEAIAPHGTGGATGVCSIVYYNYCSGWIWIYSGFAAGDEAGVAYDLPVDCGKLPGETCTNTHFWWYWRYTAPGYGFTVTYNLYNLDGQLCKILPSLGTSTSDPVERWNLEAGLGAVGSITSDDAAIIATYNAGTLPYLATDNNGKNYQAPLACPAYSVGGMHGMYWGGALTQYCPPQYFGDGYGAVEILADAGFDCQPTSTEDASWTGVKSLFR
ncbi:MAG: hypothetical protein ABIK65_05105 [Candidatus Eisenbacteria bacterium]